MIQANTNNEIEQKIEEVSDNIEKSDNTEFIDISNDESDEKLDNKSGEELEQEGEEKEDLDKIFHIKKNKPISIKIDQNKESFSEENNSSKNENVSFDEEDISVISIASKRNKKRHNKIKIINTNLKKIDDYNMTELKEIAKVYSISLSYKENDKRKLYKKEELYRNIKNYLEKN